MLSVRIRYNTIEFKKFDIHVRTLRDNQQYDDPMGKAAKVGISSATWPIFGTIWEAGEYLARLMEDYPIQGKRILEIGCGIGLPSLVLNHRGADITATDYHPETELFLKENALLNKDPEVSFSRVAWNQKKLTKSLGLFDLIIGSDLLYEEEQLQVLATFITSHARQKCVVIIVDPGRGLSSKFSNYMDTMGFPRTDSEKKIQRLRILTFQRNNI